MPEPRLLKLAYRERLRLDRDAPRQICEVVSDSGEVLGQLPVTSIKFESDAQGLPRFTVSLIAEHVEIQGHA